MTRKGALLGSLVSVVGSLVPAMAFADEGAKVAQGGLVALGAGLLMGLAVLGAGMGLGKAIASGLEAAGRNPAAQNKIQTQMIIGLVFIELGIILAFVVANSLGGVVTGLLGAH